MTDTEAITFLIYLANEYLVEGMIKEDLIEVIPSLRGIRGIMYTIGKNKTHDFSEIDKEKIKDIMFYFGG